VSDELDRLKARLPIVQAQFDELEGELAGLIEQIRMLEITESLGTEVVSLTKALYATITHSERESQHPRAVAETRDMLAELVHKRLWVDRIENGRVYFFRDLSAPVEAVQQAIKESEL